MILSRNLKKIMIERFLWLEKVDVSIYGFDGVLTNTYMIKKITTKPTGI